MKFISSLLALLSALAAPALAAVTVSSPANNSAVSSPVHYVATATSSCAKGVSAMGVYVNNQRMVVQNGSSLNANLALANGTYKTVVQEWDGCGGSATSAAYITVGGSATKTGVTVSAPMGNSTVSSPVAFSATAATAVCAKGIGAMGIYVDNKLSYTVNGSALHTSLPIATGAHYVVVEGWDQCGGAVTAPLHLNVTSATTPSVSISASPTAISSGGSSVLTVSAGNATNVSVAGSDGHSYTLPQSGGQLTVTPAATTTYTATASNSSSKATGSATVTVNGSSPTAVLVSTPANNSTVSSPVAFSATASTAACAKGIGAMGIYVDNKLDYKVNGSALNTPLPIAAGAHYVVVQAWDQCGGAIKAPLNIKVTSGSTASVSISASPTSIGPGGSSVLTVSANNASKLAITGSDGSNYPLAPGGGTQSVNPTASTSYTATATDSTGATSTAQATVTVASATGGAAVVMHRNDLAGDGVNANEVTLTPANVNATTFGKKYSLPVDGQIYAQPLYVPGLAVNGGTHNTVFVATQNDSVYAFDADSGTQLWKVSLGTPVSNNDPEGVQPTLGILSTPVIDPSTNTMYVTSVGTGRIMKLHALDIASGKEKLGGPVTVQASTPGTGNGNVNGIVPLSSGCYQRTSLTLANGQVYLAFGHCNHGWILAYDAATLAQTNVMNTSADGIGATIWMGGAGPVVDANGDLYVITADDIGTTPPANNDFPDAIMKLSPSLAVLDYFIPSNERYLEGNDADLGSGAPILLPDSNSAFPHELIGGGKDGRVFVVNRDNMGGYQRGPNGSDSVVQTVQTGTQQFDNMWGAPAFWNGTVYYHTEGDVLKTYQWNASTGAISSRPTSAGTYVYQNHGASPSISANGTSNGIVWDVDNSGYPGNGGSGGTPAILHAYDAGNVSQELYDSSQAPNGRDTAGHACKFSVPTVTDGKVFVPTCTELDIYGLLP